MITRRKFLKLLSAILPAAVVTKLPMGSMVNPVEGISFDKDPNFIWRKVGISEQEFRRMYPRSRVKFDSVNYGVVSFYSGTQWPKEAQAMLNRRRSKVLDILSRKS